VRQIAEQGILHEGGSGTKMQPNVSTGPVKADVEEDWRNLRIGRGVPKTENHSMYPRIQEVAHTEADSAVMLCTRGYLEEVPDPPEENMLKSLFTKKTDWLYCSPGQDQDFGVARETHSSDRSFRSAGSTWTANGRLISSKDLPPQLALPSSFRPPGAPPPPGGRPRIPCTRAEVTQERIIQAARGPTPKPQFGSAGTKFQLQSKGVSSFASHGPAIARAPLSAR